MKAIYSNLWRILRKNFISILFFEVAYRTATFLIVMECVQRAVDFSLKRQGYSYLTAENYVSFLMHPITILFFVIILALMLFFFLIETSTLLVCYQYSYYNEKVLISDIFLGGIRCTFRFLKKSKLTWLICVVLSAPFLTVHLLAREIAYIKLLNFTAQMIYKAVPYHWMLFAGMGILLVISLLLVFSLPYCIFEEKKSFRGMAAGIKLFTRRFKKTILGFLGLHACIFVIVGGIYLLTLTGIVLYAMVTKTPVMAVNAVLTYSSWADMTLGIVAGAVELVLSLAFVYVIYGVYHVQKRPEVSRPSFRARFRWLNKVGRRRIAAVGMAVIMAAEGVYVGGLLMNRTKIAEKMLESMGITAHRGGALMAPENTLSALQYSIDSVSDYAEIDVQETKDGEIILLHDNNFKRTAGVNANVWELNYAKISKLDAGISFNKKFRGEKIPTLDEAIKFCKGKLDLNIEIKYNGENKGIVKKVVRIIEENNFVGHCVITSMNYKFLRQVKKANPDIRTGYIMTMTYGSVSYIEDADFFSVKSTYIDEDFVNEAHSCGKEVHAWTVNYFGDIRRMMNYGVDNIITDNPVLVRKVLNGENTAKADFPELMRYALK